MRNACTETQNKESFLRFLKLCVCNVLRFYATASNMVGCPEILCKTGTRNLPDGELTRTRFPSQPDFEHVWAWNCTHAWPADKTWATGGDAYVQGATQFYVQHNFMRNTILCATQFYMHYNFTCNTIDTCILACMYVCAIQLRLRKHV